MNRQIAVALIAVSGLWALPVQAGLIVSMDNPAVVWDRDANPGGSPTITLIISSDGLMLAPSELQSFNIGLELVGGTGTLTPSDIEYATVDPVFPTFNAPSPNVTIIGGVTAIPGENNDFADEAPGVLGRNAITLNFTSSNAVGVFTLVLDEFLSSFFNASDTNEYEFTNADGLDGVLGTITVLSSSSAVPEPGTLALGLGVAVSGGLARLWRRRKAAAGE